METNKLLRNYIRLLLPLPLSCHTDSLGGEGPESEGVMSFNSVTLCTCLYRTPYPIPQSLTPLHEMIPFLTAYKINSGTPFRFSFCMIFARWVSTV